MYLVTCRNRLEKVEILRQEPQVLCTSFSGGNTALPNVLSHRQLPNGGCDECEVVLLLLVQKGCTPHTQYHTHTWGGDS